MAEQVAEVVERALAGLWKKTHQQIFNRYHPYTTYTYTQPLLGKNEVTTPDQQTAHTNILMRFIDRILWHMVRGRTYYAHCRTYYARSSTTLEWRLAQTASPDVRELFWHHTAQYVRVCALCVGKVAEFSFSSMWVSGYSTYKLAHHSKLRYKGVYHYNGGGLPYLLPPVPRRRPPC